VELADVFRRFGPDYRDRAGPSLLPSHKKALDDIAACRTAACGGQLFQCPRCRRLEYSYHSCNNRHCPKCQNDQTTEWIQKQKDSLLPTSYFFATFTVPDGLNPIAYGHQKAFYGALFRASSQALLALAKDPRFLGADIGFFGVLQTWTRDLRYHPHVHYVIPAGGLSADRGTWIPTKSKDFLVHVKPLSRLFKGLMKRELKKAGLLADIPGAVWAKDWVVHIQPAGSGLQVVKYLAPYVYRTAISNSRLVAMDEKTVTFRFKEADTKHWKHQTLDALEFIRRFLAHVLPRGFVKVRYYGFLAPNRRSRLKTVQGMFPTPKIKEPPAPPVEKPQAPPPPRPCRSCGERLVFLRELLRSRGPP
jgi:hypothetical protein